MSTQHSAGAAPSGSHAPSSGAAQPEHRALAPIRWPKPDRATVVALVIWAVGLVVAVLLPALIAPPEFGQTSTFEGTADPHVEAQVSGVRIAVAMGATLLGALVMLVAAYAVHRRTGSIGAAILAFVPSFVVVVSGAIIATMLLLG